MKNKSQRIISFLVVLLGLGVFGEAKGQTKANPVWPVDFRGTILPGNMLKKGNGRFKGETALYAASFYAAVPADAPDEELEKMIPSNLYYCQSGFFCKKEWKLEKATHIPFRFRLGSLDYCNALEGKH